MTSTYINTKEQRLFIRDIETPGVRSNSAEQILTEMAAEGTADDKTKSKGTGQFSALAQRARQEAQQHHQQLQRAQRAVAHEAVPGCCSCQ